MMRCAARMGWCMRLRVAPFCCPIPLTPAAITLSGSGRARGVAGQAVVRCSSVRLGGATATLAWVGAGRERRLV
jgi:hypothetical protein